MTSNNDFDHIILNIGHKDCLSYYTMAKAAVALRAAHQHYPNAEITLSIDGYDDDPRELWNIPETRKFIQRFAIAAGINNWNSSLFEVLSEDTKALLVACDALNKPHPFTLKMEE